MKYYLIFIFHFFYLISNSQSYHPLIRSNTYWDELHCDGTQICGFTGGDRYFFEGDTIFNSTKYNILRSYHILSYYGSPFCPPFFVDTTPYNSGIFMREDTISRKVYIYGPCDNNDCLLFDFSLNVGDSLISTYATDGDTLTVDSISMFTLNTGELRKIFYLSNQFYYIENIGGYQGIFYPLFPGIGFGEALWCINENNFNIYGSQCFYFTSITQTSENNTTIISLINKPESVEIKIKDKYKPGVIRIYNQIGQIVLTSKIYDNTVTIEKSKFKNGIYLVAYDYNNLTYYSKLIIE